MILAKYKNKNNKTCLIHLTTAEYLKDRTLVMQCYGGGYLQVNDIPDDMREEIVAASFEHGKIDLTIYNVEHHSM